MERVDPVTLWVQLPAAQWRRLQAPAEGMGCQLDAVQRRGVPYFLRRFRRRYGLLVGLALCLVCFTVGSRTILTFDVSGNETVSAQEILGQLRLCGVSVGTYGPGIPIRTVENQMMQALGQLSFFSLNIHGTRAEILVREGEEPPTCARRTSLQTSSRRPPGRSPTSSRGRGTPRCRWGTAWRQGTCSSPARWR